MLATQLELILPDCEPLAPVATIAEEYTGSRPNLLPLFAGVLDEVRPGLSFPACSPAGGA